MSFDTRNISAVMKRAEQLRRWEESDTNREPAVPKNEKGRRIKFSSGCVFLAACVAGDKDEVLRLLETGADINTANVDGLTALHQACIDDNLEMVEFLVEHGADINRQDNEGWTPLHATASCGFVSIARYLVENGADITAINSDGELAIDLVTTGPMADYLQSLVDEYGIDCEKARQHEEQLMLNDAKKWLRTDASEADKPHPKTGATALHVASAKGYANVLKLLLACRANVDKQDNDGWTPLHAAAHWGQKEACELLVEAMADMDIRNYAGQTAIDVAEKKLIKFLEELRANNKRAKRRPSSQIRISDTIENHIETPTKLIRVEVKPDAKDSANEDKSKPPVEPVKPTVETVDEDAPWRRNSSIRTRNQTESPSKTQVPDKEVKSSDSEVILRRTQSFENDEKKPVSPPVSPSTPTTTPNTGQVRRSFVPPVRDEESETQRKAHAKRVRETRRSTQGVTLDEIKSAEELVKKKNLNNNNNNSSTSEMQNTTSSTTPTTITATTTSILTTTITTTATTTPIVTVNDRVPSTTYISTDDKSNTDSTKSHQINDDITASYTITAPHSTKRESIIDDSSSKVSATYTITPPTTVNIIPSISVANRDKDDKIEKDKNDLLANKMPAVNVPINNKKTENLEKLTKTASPTVISGPFDQEKIHSEPSRIESETSSINPDSTDLNRIRDKRSLFDIDNANSLTLAEKLRNEANKYNEATRSNNDVTTIGLSKITDDNIENDGLFTRRCDSTPSSPLHHTAAERRPSWRLKFDAGSKFKLEDASAGVTFPPSNSTIITSAPAVIAAANSSAAQRRNITSNTTTQTPRPVSAPVISTTSSSSDNAADTQKDASSDNVTISLRRNKNSEDKENDKENDSRSAQATQAVIQRRRKPKRRSTGVVHLDMDDIDPERQDSPGDNEEKESGSEKASRSRLGSTSSLADGEQSDNKKDTSENGEVIDYKALWEAVKLENDKLKQMLKKKDDELVNTKATVEKFTSATTKNSLSELEKRERRAMERKLSEMEEELKLLQKLKTENERLRAENRALTRVVSKLTTSAQNQLHNKQ